MDSNFIYEVSIYKLERDSIRLIEHNYYKSKKKLDTSTKYLKNFKKKGYTLVKYIEEV